MEVCIRAYIKDDSIKSLDTARERGYGESIKKESGCAILQIEDENIYDAEIKLRRSKLKFDKVIVECRKISLHGRTICLGGYTGFGKTTDGMIAQDNKDELVITTNGPTESAILMAKMLLIEDIKELIVHNQVRLPRIRKEVTKTKNKTVDPYQYPVEEVTYTDACGHAGIGGSKLDDVKDENSQKNYLKLVEEVILPPCTGERLIVAQNGLFDVSIDREFKRWAASDREQETPEVIAQIWEQERDGDFTKLFGTLSAEIESMVCTQHQIIAFVEENRALLARWTFFLMKDMGGKICVCCIDRDGSDFLAANINQFDDDTPWQAIKKHRFVTLKQKN